MPDPLWPSSPPEANYLRLAGPGATGTATTLANAAAWQALMASNEAAAAASSANTAATAMNFEGLAGTASAATATGLNTSLQMLALWASLLTCSHRRYLIIRLYSACPAPVRKISRNV